MAKQVAVVIVDNEWFHSPGVKRFLAGRSTQRDESSHYILGPLVDDSDPLGVWLGEVTTKSLRRADGKDFDMKFLIPWRFVLALGVVDETVSDPAWLKDNPDTVVLGSTGGN